MDDPAHAEPPEQRNREPDHEPTLVPERRQDVHSDPDRGGHQADRGATAKNGEVAAVDEFERITESVDRKTRPAEPRSRYKDIPQPGRHHESSQKSKVQPVRGSKIY